MRRPSGLATQAFLALATAASLALAGGCSGKDLRNPGTPLGVFHVVGKLTTNGCVAAGGAPDPWEFDVKLNRDVTTLYWIQGDLPVQGRLDAKHHALMQSSATTQVRAADAKAKTNGCAMTRNDSLDATLASADPVTSFTGTLTYSFTPTADSDCSDQLAVAGGSWANLPCDMGYTLTATKTDKTTLP